MTSLTTILKLIIISGLGGLFGYYNVPIIKKFVEGGISYLKILSDSIPQIYEYVSIMGVYLFSFIGFFLTHIPFMFMITQIFFMFIAMNSPPEYRDSRSFNIIKVYVECNRKLFSFLINLFISFINIIINLVRAIPFI